MDENVEDLLREVVTEQTDAGRNMEGFRTRTREEVVYWLKERRRLDAANLIRQAKPFNLEPDYEERSVRAEAFDGSGWSWRLLVAFGDGFEDR
ncbi:MAG: hypothetical protein OXQ94_14290 [Gemmatimonadota bacterium]|nr:hypothetical protein [Gemmatimonadota bacterium]MDE2872846.1 hypothetical protein [Gemmatimonadota bacterium]